MPFRTESESTRTIFLLGKVTNELMNKREQEQRQEKKVSCALYSIFLVAPLLVLHSAAASLHHHRVVFFLSPSPHKQFILPREQRVIVVVPDVKVATEIKRVERS